MWPNALRTTRGSQRLSLEIATHTRQFIDATIETECV
jgi:hypothetical protein